MPLFYAKAQNSATNVSIVLISNLLGPPERTDGANMAVANWFFVGLGSAVAFIFACACCLGCYKCLNPKKHETPQIMLVSGLPPLET